MDHLFLHCPLVLSLRWRVFHLVEVDCVILPCCEYLLCIDFRGFGSNDKHKLPRNLSCVQFYGYFGFKGMQGFYRRDVKIYRVFGKKYALLSCFWVSVTH